MCANPALAADDWQNPVFGGGISRITAIGLAFPEFDSADLVSLAGRDNVALAPWPHRPGCFIAAMLDKEDAEAMTLSVAILQRAGKTVQRIAFGEFKLEEFNWANYIYLDLAPYRIRDKEFAFGVRISTSYTSTAHSSTWSTLHLFRLQGDTITHIFDVAVNSDTIEKTYHDSEASPDSNSAAPAENDVEEFSTATVHIGPVAKNGFNDLIVKTTKGEKSVDSEKILKQEKIVEKFRWNGTKYMLIK
jgi:hypothetical protein